MSNVSVVLDCSDTCKTRGCQYDKASAMLRMARSTQSEIDKKIKDARMGYALWCDKGRHPFSEHDDHMVGQRIVTKEGVKVTEDYLSCNNCMEQTETFPPPQAIAATPIQDQTPGTSPWLTSDGSRTY